MVDLRPAADRRLLLTYCTNAHPGTDLRALLASLTRHTLPLKERLFADRPMGVGVWWPASVARALAAGGVEAEEYRAFFARHNLFHFTVNAFPFGDFHAASVKERVFLPDWTDPARAAYTRAVAEALAGLLPEGVDGSISTLFGGFRHTTLGDGPRRAMRGNLLEAAGFLASLRRRTGRTVRLALEPEPFTTVETTPEAIEFFNALPAETREWLGICFDVCHQAVAFEEPPAALESLRAAGVPVYKMQLSCAPRAAGVTAGDPRLSALFALDEPRYLHQTFVRDEAGRIQRFLDLPAALAALRRGGAGGPVEVRTHFHVPIDRPDFGALSTTRDALAAALAWVVKSDPPPHLEIETYTWPLIAPSGPEGSLADGLAREFQWAMAAIA
ncbi:MAG: metabolite traffic protein EboE [Planctomycetes bacterium]|nr:metabolite traffic protein EboE [Planctomycetota bacterium]